MDFDISLVLTLHREGKYLLRTLQSLREAAVYARQFGISTELVAVLDRTDQLTADVLAAFDLAGFDGHQIIRADNGSLGPSRNDGTAIAKGKYISICDGDDLISYNYLAAMHKDIERDGPRVALFPHYLVGFGARYHVGEYLNLGNITPLALVHMHPFVSRIFAHRNLFAMKKYSDVKLSDGYAYEDWHFHCEITSLGYELAVAKDTILFYRQRTGSLLNQADSLSVRQIPPSRLFIPANYIDACDAAYHNLANVEDKRANMRTKGPVIVSDPVCLELMAAANAIDPAVDPVHIGSCETYTNATWIDIHIGRAYYEICRLIGDNTFSDVFILPHFGGGGAELYALKIMHELHAQKLSGNILLLLGEKFDKHLWLEQLPPSATVIDLATGWPQLSTDSQDLLTLKIIQSCAPNARVHFRQSWYGERFFAQYKAVLQQTNQCIFYRFGNMMRSEGQYQVIRPAGFQFSSENLEFFAKIIADNETIIKADQARLGVAAEKWQCLRVPHSPKVKREAAVAKALLAGPNVLWASRLAVEKRPSLLPAIAKRLYAARPDIKLFVHGTDAFGEFDLATIKGLPNLSFEGPFSKFDEIAAGDFSCFIYTSWFDGMPNVVLEAVSMGLPVIAPDVGGIAEVIADGETGVLLPSILDDEVMAKAYTDAIINLVDNPQLRARYVGASIDRMIEQRSPEKFAQRIAALFEPI